MTVLQLSALLKGGPGQVQANAQGMMMQKMMEQMMKQGGAAGGAGGNPFAGGFPGGAPGAFMLLSRNRGRLLQVFDLHVCGSVATGCTCA